MPQLGETVTEGTITRWLKQVGDTVAEDEVLFEVSTDKVDSEVPSPASGVVTEILVPEGETVDVGTKLAVIGDGAASPAAAEAAEPAAVAAAPATDAAEAAAPPTKAETAAAPVAATANDAAGALQAPAVEHESPAPPTNGAGTRPAPRLGEGLNLSPVVRRLITEHQIDPAQITGTGAGGRITRSDVLDFIDHQHANGAAPSAPAAPAPGTAAPATPAAPGTQTAPAPAAAAPAAPAAGRAAPFPPATAGDRDIVIPFTNIRRRTAEHMVRSKATSAHVMVAIEVDYAAVDKVRSAQRTAFREAEGFSLTYLPFITRAVVDALEEFPNVNSSVGEDQLIVHQDRNVGIAVDLDFDGLLVPVIHQADGLRLRQIARDISALATRARARKLTMDDISGGTITLTNAGPFGTFITVPVINQPQVAIISTDGVRKRPVAVELPDGSDAVVVHPVGNLVMSWDHRAFDGAYAAAFMAKVKTILETRDWAPEL